MAYMNRGETPSINLNSGEQHENTFYRFRFYTYVPLDNTYVVMQMIITFIILIVGAISILIIHKPNIIDPIENIKNTFLNTHLITIAVLVILSFVVNFISKNVKELIKKLTILVVICITTMMIFFGIKINLDTTYNQKKFEQFYNEQNTSQMQKENKKNKLDIGLTGVQLKTEKQYYIDECIESYNVFKIKSTGILILHLLLCLLIVYLIIRVQKINTKKDILKKDDLILFDEEENVKM